jgi:aromatic ring-opening dioxygenase LigB subunit
MSANKKTLVHLRLYKGKTGQSGLSYNEDRSVQNENSKVSLTHGTLEWANFLKRCRNLGMIQMKVEQIFHPKAGGGWSAGNQKLQDQIGLELEKAFNGSKVEKLTPEQREIAELKAQMADLLATQKGEETPTEKAAKKEVAELRKAEAEEAKRIKAAELEAKKLAEEVEK